MKAASGETGSPALDRSVVKVRELFDNEESGRKPGGKLALSCVGRDRRSVRRRLVATRRTRRCGICLFFGFQLLLELLDVFFQSAWQMRMCKRERIRHEYCNLKSR